MTMPGNKSYTIEYLASVAKKDIPKFSQSIRLLIKHAIEERLIVDPIGFGKPLQYSLKGHRRFRVGDYRIIYRIASSGDTVIIIAIKHRKEVYKDF